MIRDKRLLGEHTRYDGSIIKNVYPEIIEQDLFDTANRMMDTVMVDKKKSPVDLLLKSTTVQEIFRLFDERMSTGSIVKTLIENEKGNEESIGKWSTVNVLRVLRDKAVVEHKIIDNLTFERVNNRLNKKGIANRIRKDITIAHDDYITNLFPKILRCGSCGGNISIHYNHVRMKYVICRTREEKKRCDAKSIQYTRIERHILEKLRGVDFSTLMAEKKDGVISILEKLKTELSALRTEEEVYLKQIAERRKAKRRSSAVLDSGLVEVQDQIDELQQRINNSDKEVVIPELIFNIDEALDPTNVELRARIRKEIKQVVKMIKYRIIAKNIILEVNYYSDVLKHIIIVENKKDNKLISEVAISIADNITTYQTPTFSLVEQEGVITLNVDEKINILDYSLFLNYLDGLDNSNVAFWMREHFNHLTNEANSISY